VAERKAAETDRTQAQRADSPERATASSYQGSSVPEKVTMPKRWPSRQAVSIAASAIPTMGRSNSSRAAISPGSPKAAMTAASKPA
jgi:hypothetical protein